MTGLDLRLSAKQESRKEKLSKEELDIFKEQAEDIKNVKISVEKIKTTNKVLTKIRRKKLLTMNKLFVARK